MQSIRVPSLSLNCSQLGIVYAGTEKVKVPSAVSPSRFVGLVSIAGRPLHIGVTEKDRRRSVELLLKCLVDSVQGSSWRSSPTGQAAPEAPLEIDQEAAEGAAGKECPEIRLRPVAGITSIIPVAFLPDTELNRRSGRHCHAACTGSFINSVSCPGKSFACPGINHQDECW
jgi:hypothetical protein